jgi:hypothetical protein
VDITTAGTTQNSTGGVLRGAGNKVVRATFHAATGAITLPADAGIADEVLVANVTANAGRVFPQTGGNINGLTTDLQVTVAAQGSAASSWRFVKINATRWSGMASA